MARLKPQAPPKPEDTVNIRWRLESVKCDPVQYQPQQPKWVAAMSLYVDIPVPNSLVREIVDGPDESSGYLLTQDGYKFVIKWLENLAINAHLP